jgi:hypothetical protein
MTPKRFRPHIATHLAAMLVLGSTVFLIGAIQKAPCANVDWVVKGEGAPFPCYSDVSDLYVREQLAGGRVPYLDPCVASSHPCDEYPVGTMLVMRAAAWAGGGGSADIAGFFWATMVVLLACVLVIIWALERLNARTVLFAASPVLCIYGSMNWDLLPVALATVATLAFVVGRDRATGIFVGLGAAAKLYPALLLIPFGAEHLRKDNARGLRRMTLAAVISWSAMNLPFALLAVGGWWEFYRFNGPRPPDYESLWYLACKLGLCPSTAVINIVTPIAAVLGTALIWRSTIRRNPNIPRWQLAYPLLVVVLITSKVWSPQYGLWLLPWLALSGVGAPVYFEYQLSETLLFMVRFMFFASVQGGEGVSYPFLGAAVVLRAAMLIRCTAHWVRQPQAAGLAQMGDSVSADVH